MNYCHHSTSHPRPPLPLPSLEHFLPRTFNAHGTNERFKTPCGAAALSGVHSGARHQGRHGTMASGPSERMSHTLRQGRGTRGDPDAARAGTR